MEDNGIFGLTDDSDIESFNTSVDDLDRESINIIFVAIDRSGSMGSYKASMEDSLKSFKDSIANSKECDEILVSRANFDDAVEITGYKKIQEFDTSYKAYGSTVLYDVIVEGKEKLVAYMNHLKASGMRVKAVFAVFTDGEDNVSRRVISSAKAAITELNNMEVATAFIAFGPDASQYCQSLGFTNNLQVGASESELRKAFNCLSKSVIKQSQSLVNATDNFFV